MGQPRYTLRRQYVVPQNIRSLRFGQIIFLNVPQYVNLDVELNHQGIAPSTQWGENEIGYPPVQPSPHRPVYPVGFSATLWGTHRVELLHPFHPCGWHPTPWQPRVAAATNSACRTPPAPGRSRPPWPRRPASPWGRSCPWR